MLATPCWWGPKGRNSCPWLLINRVKWLCAWVMCWPHRVGVSVCHLAFIVVISCNHFSPSSWSYKRSLCKAVVLPPPPPQKKKKIGEGIRVGAAVHSEVPTFSRSGYENWGAGRGREGLKNWKRGRNILTTTPSKKMYFTPCSAREKNVLLTFLE